MDKRSLLGFLCLGPIALLSAQACGGNALESRGSGGGNGLSGSSGAEAGRGGEAGKSSGGAPDEGGGSGGLDARVCTSNTQCEVVPVSCCSCGSAGPISNFTAINSAYSAQFNERCAAVDCAPCLPTPMPGLNDPSFYVVATCERPIDAPEGAPGHCALVDLRATEITACKSASDCSLREGTACCQGCLGQPVALAGRQGSALSALVCDGQSTSCPACAPNFYGYQTVCDSGRCGIALTPTIR